MPIRQRESIVQPWRITPWPTVTVVAENERMRVAHHVQHGAVLNIRARADADEIDVAANHGAGPDARLLADDDVADDDGLRVNVGDAAICGMRPW